MQAHRDFIARVHQYQPVAPNALHSNLNIFFDLPERYRDAPRGTTEGLDKTLPFATIGPTVCIRKSAVPALIDILPRRLEGGQPQDPNEGRIKILINQPGESVSVLRNLVAMSYGTPPAYCVVQPGFNPPPVADRRVAWVDVIDDPSVPYLPEFITGLLRPRNMPLFITMTARMAIGLGIMDRFGTSLHPDHVDIITLPPVTEDEFVDRWSTGFFMSLRRHLRQQGNYTNADLGLGEQRDTIADAIAGVTEAWETAAVNAAAEGSTAAIATYTEATAVAAAAEAEIKAAAAAALARHVPENEAAGEVPEPEEANEVAAAEADRAAADARQARQAAADAHRTATVARQAARDATDAAIRGLRAPRVNLGNNPDVQDTVDRLQRLFRVGQVRPRDVLRWGETDAQQLDPLKASQHARAIGWQHPIARLLTSVSNPIPHMYSRLLQNSMSLGTSTEALAHAFVEASGELRLRYLRNGGGERFIAFQQVWTRLQVADATDDETRKTDFWQLCRDAADDAATPYTLCVPASTVQKFANAVLVISSYADKDVILTALKEVDNSKVADMPTYNNKKVEDMKSNYKNLLKRPIPTCTAYDPLFVLINFITGTSSAAMETAVGTGLNPLVQINVHIPVAAFATEFVNPPVMPNMFSLDLNHIQDPNRRRRPN